MANGPFGNPLSTGIALSFEVDMTPYRQMHARKMANIEEKKKERKKQQAELQDILKNVTVDTSKIHERYKDDAMNEYASTIDDVMKMYKEGNVAGVYNRINKFNNGINSYVSATDNFKNYVKSDGGKTLKNEELIRAMNDVENVDDKTLAEMFQGDIDYSNGMFNFTVFDRLDVDGYINKLAQGAEKGTMYDDSGKPIIVGRMAETDEVEYREVVKNPGAVINSTLAWMLDGGNKASTTRMLMNEYPELNPSNLDQRDPNTGETLLESRLKDYVSRRAENKLYGTRIGKIPKEKDRPSYGRGAGETAQYTFEFVKDTTPIYGNIPSERGGAEDYQELLVDTQNSIIFQNKGKTAKKFSVNIPTGSFELGTEGGGYVPIKGTQKGLNDAVAVSAFSDKDGKVWYKVASKAEIEALDLYKTLYESGDGDVDYTQLAKYAKTYLIPSNKEIESQFWQGVGVTKDVRENILKDLTSGSSTTGTSSTSGYTQITKLTDSSGNTINAGVKGGKWYNIDTGEEIK